MTNICKHYEIPYVERTCWRCRRGYRVCPLCRDNGLCPDCERSKRCHEIGEKPSREMR